jgi:hypothetical protein
MRLTDWDLTYAYTNHKFSPGPTTIDGGFRLTKNEYCKDTISANLI